MKYNIREKFWSWGGDFHILDETGAPVYFVDGAAFSWGSKLSFQDMAGNELAFIEQKLFSFLPHYRIHRNGELFAEVLKEFTWFKKRFTLDVPGPNDYQIDGSFWDHEYVFTRGGRVVARVSRAIWSWTDCYGIETVAGVDDISILCTAIVIDQVLHDEDD